MASSVQRIKVDSSSPNHWWGDPSRKSFPPSLADLCLLFRCFGILRTLPPNPRGRSQRLSVSRLIRMFPSSSHISDFLFIRCTCLRDKFRDKAASLLTVFPSNRDCMILYRVTSLIVNVTSPLMKHLLLVLLFYFISPGG